MQRVLPLVSAVALAGCATTPAGLADTRVEKTVASSKSSQAFANCVADNLPGDVQIRSEGAHYWVMIYTFDTPRHRWDFTPTTEGSVAQLRSTGLAGAMTGTVEKCA